MDVEALLKAAEFIERQEEMKKATQMVTSPATTTTTLRTPPPTVVIANSSRSTERILSHAVTHTVQVLSSAQPLVVQKEVQPEQQHVISSTSNLRPQRVFQNSFDIINPLVIDESGQTSNSKGPKSTPLSFRTGTREVHNKLEKDRRAHLKECFDILKKQLPTTPDEKKTSNLSILHSALRHINNLKKRDKELEKEMENLAREKINLQQRLGALKRDISTLYDNVDFSKLIPDTVPHIPNLSEATALFSHSESVAAITANSSHTGHSRLITPGPGKPTQQITIATTQVATLKEISQQTVPTNALSVVPVGYPAGVNISQGLVLQKVAIVQPKGMTDLSPLVSTHFITQQHINGTKVVPLVNAQYVVKPVVVVSRPS